MQHVISMLEQHSLLIVFINALLKQAGLPLPVVPTLMTAAALTGQNPYQVSEIVLVGVAGALIGDFAQYWGGRRYGRLMLGLLCRVSFSPDFCVRQTETVFAKIGPWSLLVAKFVPGLSTISVAMAGVTKMTVAAFCSLDAIGSFLFVAAIVALGLVFQNAIANVVATLTDLGEFGIVVILAAVGLYLLARWWRRRLFIRQLRMDRISVVELRKLIDEGQTLLILDVRPKEVRAQEGIIPGAISAHPADIDPIVANYSRDLDVVVYCACPNEDSAATAARHLKQAGFKKIRPLLGGIDAWIEAGHPIEHAHFTPEEIETVDLAGASAGSDLANSVAQ
jgi:membrane protein DedA with SNARE-associated domain/rhodanese-related sulfurtransferase